MLAEIAAYGLPIRESQVVTVTGGNDHIATRPKIGTRMERGGA